eukprot:gene21501-28482_t
MNTADKEKAAPQKQTGDWSDFQVPNDALCFHIRNFRTRSFSELPFLKLVDATEVVRDHTKKFTATLQDPSRCDKIKEAILDIYREGDVVHLFHCIAEVHPTMFPALQPEASEIHFLPGYDCSKLN